MSSENIKKYLDENGLSILWSEVEQRFINTDEIQAIVELIDKAKADKTEIPSTLPANGGNADSLGGYPASSYVRVADANDPEPIVYVINCGSATELID